MRKEKLDKVNGFVYDMLVINNRQDLADEIAKRRNEGIETYGQDIHEAELSIEEVAQHAKEELMDLTIYLRKIVQISRDKVEEGKLSKNEKAKYLNLEHRAHSMCIDSLMLLVNKIDGLCLDLEEKK